MDPNKHVDRRRFFREGLRELLRPLADAIDPLHEAAKHLERIDQFASQVKSAGGAATNGARRIAASVALRPPGALPEQSFLDTCSRCRACVEVCPAGCIKIDSGGAVAGGAPYIDPVQMPCVVCDGLQCMHVCPTGALVPTALADIDMGTALWDPETCVRQDGQDCTICVDRCPIGSVAIELKGDRIEVHPDSCTGCGVCEHDCPTTPKSIFVIPIAAKSG